MQASVESRLRYLEDRVKLLESLVGAPAAASRPPARAVEAAPPTPPRERPDLEELLGGRVLAWVGGIAVVLAAVFFLVMAVHNGWIDETTRVLLAFLGSTALLGVSVWLYERKGRTQAARAGASAAFAAIYASDTAATAVYHLVPTAAGLTLAGLTGIAAAIVAVRWSSPEIAGIGIVGALLAPVLVDAGTSTSSLAFMAFALVGAVGVLLWRRWSWLAVLAYAVSAPQAAAWVSDERDDRLWLSLAVIGLFWALYVVAAIGYEVRVPTTKLRLSSASLLFANASLTALAGWAMLHDAGNGDGATAWVLAVAAAHVVLAAACLRGRVSREICAFVAGVGAALAAFGLALALDGPALVAGWTAEGVLLAWLTRKIADKRGSIGAVVFLGLAAVHALVLEAPPSALAYGLDSVPRAVVALVVVTAGVAAVGLLLPTQKTYIDPTLLEWIAAGLAVYLGSVLVVDAAGGHPGAVDQHAQLALSAFWAALGFGSLVAGLLRDTRPLRLAGLALLGLAVAKVFLVDLAALQSIWRVASFLALGLLLLAGAFASQRMRKELHA